MKKFIPFILLLYLISCGGGIVNRSFHYETLDEFELALSKIESTSEDYSIHKYLILDPNNEFFTPIEYSISGMTSAKTPTDTKENPILSTNNINIKYEYLNNEMSEVLYVNYSTRLAQDGYFNNLKDIINYILADTNNLNLTVNQLNDNKVSYTIKYHDYPLLQFNFDGYQVNDDIAELFLTKLITNYYLLDFEIKLPVKLLDS